MSISKEILMPIGTALWLTLHTNLSVDQIAEFCNLSPLKVISLKEEANIPEYDPTVITLTKEEITRCELDPNAKLRAKYYKKSQDQGRKYVGPYEKQKLPGVIAWLITNNHKFNGKKLAKIFSTTSKYIEKLQNNLVGHIPLHPIQSGLLSEQELQEIII